MASSIIKHIPIIVKKEFTNSEGTGLINTDIPISHFISAYSRNWTNLLTFPYERDNDNNVVLKLMSATSLEQATDSRIVIVVVYFQ